MNHRRLLLAGCAALALVACSKPPESTVAGAGAPVMIAATDSGYVAPDTLPAGLNHIAFENHGSSIHECAFIRLPDGMSAQDYVALVAGGSLFPEGAIDCSGPGLASPAERVEVWVPLEPGRYLLGCWYRDDMTTIPPRTIVVAGDPPAPVSAPREDATIRLIDFRFEIIGSLRPGLRTIKVETLGPSMHEVDIYRLDGGRTVDDLKAWYANGKNGAPPATAMSGALDSHDLKRVVWLRRQFTMGKYVLYCAMPMIQHGNTAEQGAAAEVTHAQAGMIKEFSIE